MVGTDVLLNVFIGAMTAAVSGLCTLVIKGINIKIQTEKLNKTLNEALRIVHDGVVYIYQTYVDNIKGTDEGNLDTMEIAKAKAIDYIVSHLSKDSIQYISSLNMSISQWVDEQIEIVIKCVKNDGNKFK